jgi:DNA-binding response OmpR family regulator
MKVLVVEDCVGERSIVCASLQRRNYRVQLVCDEGEAIARAAQEDFGLIILDLMQPSKSSLLLLHELRQMNRDSKILILSTPEQIGDRVTALIQGADDYLVKPFTAEELHARILPLDNPLQSGEVKTPASSWSPARSGSHN